MSRGRNLRNAAGQQTSMTDPNGNTTRYVYDGLGRRIETIYADGTTATVTYDALGRKVSATDQNGNITNYAYDQLGELLTVTQAPVAGPADGGMVRPVTAYSYNNVGNEISQTDANGNTTTFAYDVLGRKIARTLPMGQTESWTYDANGNMLTHTDFNGHTTTYAYNALNQMVSQTPDAYFAGEAAITYTYTPDGQVSTMTDGTGTTTYTYDHRNDLISVAAPEGTLTYTYDSQGNETSVHSADGNGINETFTYDALNRLSSATDNLAFGTTSYAYDTAGNLVTVTDPSGVVTTYAYDSLNRLTAEVVTDNSGNTLASYAYALDNVGNRIGVTETLLLQLLPNRTTDTRTVAYTLDSLYRLLSETITGDSQGGNGTVSYTYDLVGNRLSRTSSVAGVSTSTSQYNANNELTSETAAGVTTTYTYDANGNTIETSGGGVTATFTYDSQNRLVKQNAGTASEVDIAYDGQGNKVAETANGVTTTYLIDTNNPTGYSQVVEEIVNGLVTRRYALGQWIISETQLINGAWVGSFYNYDGHNTVRFLTNASGAVTDNYTFDAFGIKIAGAGTTPNQILYTGEYLDPGTGNYDLRARVYNQNTGTFLTRDTYAGQNQDPTTLHQYLYAGGNPVSAWDPSGNTAASVLGTWVHTFLARRFEEIQTPQSTTRYFGNRWISTIFKRLYGGSMPMNRLRPDLVEATVASGDIYEIKRGPISSLGDPVVYAVAAAVAVGEAQFYQGALTSAMPQTSWSLGATVWPIFSAWPTFKHAPPETVLATFDDYSVAPGAVLYDFIPVRDDDESLLEAAIAVSAGGAVGSGIAALISSRFAQQQALATADEMISVAGSGASADLVGSVGLATVDTLAA